MKNTEHKRIFFSRITGRLTDFGVSSAMFILVIIFASVHAGPAPALPAPMARTQAALVNSPLGQSMEQRNLVLASIYDEEKRGVVMSGVSPIRSISSHVARSGNGAKVNGGMHIDARLIFMALLFAAMTSLTLHLWRDLKREQAPSRRRRGWGDRY